MDSALFWECDVNGSEALRPEGRRRYISPVASQFIVRRLMHEVSTLSATFGEHDLVVFTNLMGVSEFDDEGGIFYGLYASWNEREGLIDYPDFCIRKVTWTKGFRDIETVLQGLTATTLFFDSLKCDKWRGIVLDVDADLESKVAGTQVIAKTQEKIKKRVGYFAVGDVMLMQGEYRSPHVCNAYVENKFEEFAFLFGDVVTQGGVCPEANTFRISYTFDGLEFLKGRNLA